ncbi:hypothetical protein, partial [Streptomyces sp. NPDC056049]|uniref:hypothetical protein n=1 Tax=Streptomyces sp. NPDC056049 TaxID=3345693 RepID=UPI0035DF83EF
MSVVPVVSAEPSVVPSVVVSAGVSVAPSVVVPGLSGGESDGGSAGESDGESGGASVEGEEVSVGGLDGVEGVGVDVVAVGERVDGHGDGVTP